MKMLPTFTHLAWFVTLILTIIFIGVLDTRQEIVDAQSTSDETAPEIIIPNVKRFAKSPVEDVIVVMETSGTLYLWDIQTQTNILDLESDIENPIGDITLGWSPNGNFIFGTFIDGGRLWDANTGELLHIFDVHR